jgi:hypothetical protein
MSDQISIDTRLTIAGISYGGMGFAFARGRDLSRKIFHITDQSRERTQTIHDIAYTAAFNLAIAPPLYIAMGADVKQAIIGGLSAAAMSTIMGPLSGYSIDAARDLTGLRDCERPSYPKLIRRQKNPSKKVLLDYYLQVLLLPWQEFML